MVLSDKLDKPSIIAAIKAGRFYASQGPEIYKIETTPERIRIECSPANQIRFISNEGSCAIVFASEGSVIEEASLNLNQYVEERISFHKEHIERE